MPEHPVILRDFTPDDYPAIARVVNSVYTEYPVSERELRFEDESREPKCRFHRFVAEADGEIVATGTYSQHPMQYHPRKFTLDIMVRPERQGQGIGRALWNRLLEALEPADPIALHSMTREDKHRSVRFLTDRGMVEDRRLWESRLDATRFDFTPYEGLVDSLQARGIEIRTYRELVGEPGFFKKLIELDWAGTLDVPLSDPPTRMSDEVFEKYISGHPGLLPDAFFIALHNGEFVGMSNLWASEGNADLYTGFTCTTRPYRHQGIALACKLKALAWARDRGCTRVKTWNDSQNKPMLAINERLGFVKQPVWIKFWKRLKEEGEGQAG